MLQTTSEDAPHAPSISQTLEPIAQSAATDVFLNWLHSGQTGCVFAKRFAKGSQSRVDVVEFPDPFDGSLASNLDLFLASAASRKKTVAAIFPKLRTQAEAAQVCVELLRSSRWKFQTEKFSVNQRPAFLFSLRWQTQTQNQSVALGLGPFGAMPLTRRAPYVSLALWPGGHDNPHRHSNKVTVSLADMWLDYDEEKHQEAWTKSEQNKIRFLADQSEGAASIKVTFCFEECTRKVFVDAGHLT